MSGEAHPAVYVIAVPTGAGKTILASDPVVTRKEAQAHDPRLPGAPQHRRGKGRAVMRPLLLTVAQQAGLHLTFMPHVRHSQPFTHPVRRNKEAESHG
jgi:hypothetical protein